MSIGKNLKDINDRIVKAAQRSGRNPSEIKLVCVTKNISPEKITEAISLGISDIGESRIQEAEKKYPQLSNLSCRLTWHLIGHLQTNKVKKAVVLFDLIHSLDSEHLAREIDKHSQKINKIQDCLIEVKVSEEPTKYGCLPEKLQELIEKTFELKNIRILGLMAMAPFFENPQFSRPYFKRAKELFDKIRSDSPHLTSNFSLLSMGMSNDFEVAIEEGSNMVRIGTAIFKEY